MGKHFQIQKDDVCYKAWNKKLAACKRWKRCSMHPSEQKEINCIKTNRWLLSVFVLAQRNMQHAHIRIDIECINIYRERITASIHTERWWLMSHLQEKELQHTHVRNDYMAHAIGIREVNSTHTNWKMLTDILYSDGKVQHSPMESDVGSIHRNRDKYTASRQSERCWLFPYLPKDMNIMHTSGKLLKHTACTLEDRYFIHQHVQEGDIHIYPYKKVMSLVTLAEQKL